MTSQSVVPLGLPVGPFDEVKDELLHQSARSRVFRRYLSGQPSSIICKEFRGAQAAQRKRHELKILERLSGIKGMPTLVHLDGAGQMLALEDGDCLPLDRIAKKHTFA
jgi:hypothetical protein